jgi:peptidoglycan/xylan/chitin deacetylase (PgdA/CDA1 family)
LHVAALILTYHAVEAGPSPLCVDPALFAAHADVIADAAGRCVTVREIADLLTSSSEERLVAITFDDGFASVAEVAAPALQERGLVATVFCVAGHLGGANDWASARKSGYQSRLADAATISELAASGFEVGSHGWTHAPLAGATEEELRAEIADSCTALEQAVGTRVTSFAYPYGALPGKAGRTLVNETYDAACTTRLGRAASGVDLHTLPRIDAHYLRSPELLRRAIEGKLDGYLRVRSLAARARRTVVKDYGRHSRAAAHA